MENLEKRREEATRKCYMTYLGAYKDNVKFKKLIKNLEESNNKDKFINYLMFYIKNYVRPNINKQYTIIENLISLNDKEECFKYLDTISFDKKDLNQKINRYLIEFRPDIILNDKKHEEMLAKIKNILNQYDLKNYKSRELKTDYDKERYAIARKYVLLYLDSKYTVERFCMQQRINKLQVYFKM